MPSDATLCGAVRHCAVLCGAPFVERPLADRVEALRLPAQLVLDAVPVTASGRDAATRQRRCCGSTACALRVVEDVEVLIEALRRRGVPAARCELSISGSAGWARGIRRVRVRRSLDARVRLDLELAHDRVPDADRRGGDRVPAVRGKALATSRSCGEGAQEDTHAHRDEAGGDRRAPPHLEHPVLDHARRAAVVVGAQLVPAADTPAGCTDATRRRDGSRVHRTRSRATASRRA